MHKDNSHQQLYNLTIEDSLLAKIHTLEYEKARRSEALTQEMLRLWYGCDHESRKEIVRFIEELTTVKQDDP